jgi:hypothetical protein
VFTARYALSPYIKQIYFVFKGLISGRDLRVCDDIMVRYSGLEQKEDYFTSSTLGLRNTWTSGHTRPTLARCVARDEFGSNEIKYRIIWNMYNIYLKNFPPWNWIKKTLSSDWRQFENILKTSTAYISPEYDKFRPKRDSICRSLWPPSLRRGSAAARFLGLRGWISQGACIPVCCECCVLPGRGLCEGPIPHPEE